MGLFKRMLGKKGGAAPAPTATAPRGEYKQCDACGDLAEVPTGEANMAIFTSDISAFELGGLAGFCPSCGRFLCVKHIEFQNPSGGEMGPWHVACVQCSVPIQSVP
jgi:hypothetical protein